MRAFRVVVVVAVAAGMRIAVIVIVIVLGVGRRVMVAKRHALAGAHRQGALEGH